MLLKSKSEQERRLLTALVNKVSYLFFYTMQLHFISLPFFQFQYMQNYYDLVDWKQRKIKYIILFMSNIA